MKKSGVLISLLFLLISFFYVNPGIAQDLKGRWGVNAFGGITRGNFDDINTFFSNFNSIFNNDYYDQFKGGVNLGGEIKYGISKAMTVGLSLSYFKDDMNVEYIEFSQEIGDATDTYTLERNVKLFSLPVCVNLYYNYPFREKINLFLGGGIGIYPTSFSSKTTIYTSSLRKERAMVYDFFENGYRHWNGSTAGMNVNTGFEYFLKKDMAVMGKFNYRFANLQEVSDFNNDPFRQIDPEAAKSLDYGKNMFTRGQAPVEFNLSGPSFLVGVSYYF